MFHGAVDAAGPGQGLRGERGAHRTRALNGVRIGALGARLVGYSLFFFLLLGL
jgi:hypothetical protein